MKRQPDISESARQRGYRTSKNTASSSEENLILSSFSHAIVCSRRTSYQGPRKTSCSGSDIESVEFATNTMTSSCAVAPHWRTAKMATLPVLLSIADSITVSLHNADSLNAITGDAKDVTSAIRVATRSVMPILAGARRFFVVSTNMSMSNGSSSPRMAAEPNPPDIVLCYSP